MTIHILIQNGAIERQLACVLRDLLATETFADATALRERFEERARALGLSASRERLERALDLVGSNTQLLTGRRPRPLVERPAEPPTIQRAEAAAILHGLGIDVRGARVRRTSADVSAPNQFPALVPVR